VRAIVILGEQHDYHIAGAGGLLAIHWIILLLCFPEFRGLHKQFKNVVQSTPAILLNAQDDEGDTPLTKLMRILSKLLPSTANDLSGQQNRFLEIPDVLQCMINHGASSSIPNKQGVTALMMACENNTGIADQVINLSTTKSANYQHPVTLETALHIFVKKKPYSQLAAPQGGLNKREDNAKLLKKLLEFIDPNLCDASGCTPFMITCQFFYFEWIMVFVEHKGCDLNIRNAITGQTALHLLCQHAEPLLKRTDINWDQIPQSQLANDPNQVILFLIKSGADPTIKDNKGLSCIDLLPFLLGDQ